jgi:hypothetical protein
MQTYPYSYICQKSRRDLFHLVNICLSPSARQVVGFICSVCYTWRENYGSCSLRCQQYCRSIWQLQDVNNTYPNHYITPKEALEEIIGVQHAVLVNEGRTVLRCHRRALFIYESCTCTIGVSSGCEVHQYPNSSQLFVLTLRHSNRLRPGRDSVHIRHGPFLVRVLNHG